MRRRHRRISPGKSCETPYIYAAQVPAHIQKTTLRHVNLSAKMLKIHSAISKRALCDRFSGPAQPSQV